MTAPVYNGINPPWAPGEAGGTPLSAERFSAMDAGTVAAHGRISELAAALPETVRDVIGAALVQGANVALTVNDAGDTITIGITGLAAVATSGAYSDLSGKPTIPAGYTDEQARDAVGAALAAAPGSNISVTLDDANDRIVIAVAGLAISNVAQLQAALDGKAPALPEATTTPRTAALGAPSGLLGYTNRYALNGAVTEALPPVTDGAVLAFAVTAGSTASLTLTRNGTDYFGDGTTTSLVLAPGDYYLARGQVNAGQGRWRRVSAPLYSEQDTHFDARYVVTTIADLRALSNSAPATLISVRGYSTAGDGGGGLFRWDPSDTTTADNGGTIIVPISGGGRWKRVYEGEVNARWFGMHPSKSDNTAALQAAVSWVANDTSRSPSSTTTGGTVFIPMGYYRCTFADGGSGFSTITINTDNVLIRGEGRGTILTPRTPTNRLSYFFTFKQPQRGQGGGVRDLHIEGNAQMLWCIYLDTWRNASFEHISARDVFGGILDAQSTDTVNMGENIAVRHLDYIPSASTGSCIAQYGIRFRAAPAPGTSWSDSSIRDSLFVGVWDTGVVLDGVQRFTVSQIGACWNKASSNTIDGSTRGGIFHAVVITNSATNNPAYGADTGCHIVESIYMESHYGTETTAANVAVLIDTPAGQTGLNRLNKVRDIAVSADIGPGIVQIMNSSGTLGLTALNTFEGNRRALLAGQVQVGAGVADTFLYLTANQAQLANVQDQGTRTFINSYGATVQPFTSSGTWVKPPGATTVQVAALGGGGGGGAGRRTQSGTTSSGGAGGGGAGWTTLTIPASALGATETVTVGIGGAGAAGVTTDGTNGATGTPGGTSSFGSKARSIGGAGGPGGSTGSVSGGAGGNGVSVGGAGGGAAVGVAGTSGGTGNAGGAGGGGGGGLAATPAVTAGGSGGLAVQLASAAGGLGGITDGAAGSPGTSATANHPVGGSGAGGGASSTTGAGGNGATGGSYGGGGGGGGASLNGANSGAGGAGGAGIVIVTSW